MENLTGKNCAGSSLPLLKRNLRRSLKTLQEQSKSIFNTVDQTAVYTMVDTGSMKKLPFLKRNIYIPKEIYSPKSRRKGVISTRKKATPDSTNVRRQYRVHYLKYESSKKMKKNTIMTSCFFPAYQCPICLSYEGVDFENLWFHCTSIHGDQYIFHPIQTTNQEHHLLIEKNQTMATPDNMLNKTDVLFCRRSSTKSADSVKPSSTFQKEFKKRVPLPIRTYYHDATFSPISLTEWICGSMTAFDNENDQEWRRIVDTSALYDLTDVTGKEKLFMVVWNEYMRNNPIIAALQLPSQLESFVKFHSSLIFDNQLEDELIKHLTNMWVEGHLGREDMLENIKTYNSLVVAKHCCCNVSQP